MNFFCSTNLLEPVLFHIHTHIQLQAIVLHSDTAHHRPTFTGAQPKNQYSCRTVNQSRLHRRYRLKLLNIAEHIWLAETRRTIKVRTNIMRVHVDSCIYTPHVCVCVFRFFGHCGRDHSHSAVCYLYHITVCIFNLRILHSSFGYYVIFHSLTKIACFFRRFHFPLPIFINFSSFCLINEIQSNGFSAHKICLLTSYESRAAFHFYCFGVCEQPKVSEIVSQLRIICSYHDSIDWRMENPLAYILVRGFPTHGAVSTVAHIHSFIASKFDVIFPCFDMPMRMNIAYSTS